MRIREIILESDNDKLIVRLSRHLYTYLIRRMEQGVDSDEYVGILGDAVKVDWKSVPNGDLLAATELWIVPDMKNKAMFAANTHDGNKSSLIFNQAAFDTSTDTEHGMGRDDRRDIATIAHELAHLFDHVRHGTPNKSLSKSRIKGNANDEYYSSTAEINARTLEAKSNIAYAIGNKTDFSNKDLMYLINDELAELEIEEYIPGGSDSKAFKQIVKRLFVFSKEVLEMNKQNTSNVQT